MPEQAEGVPQGTPETSAEPTTGQTPEASGAEQPQAAQDPIETVDLATHRKEVARLVGVIKGLQNKGKEPKEQSPDSESEEPAPARRDSRGRFETRAEDDEADEEGYVTFEDMRLTPQARRRLLAAEEQARQTAQQVAQLSEKLTARERAEAEAQHAEEVRQATTQFETALGKALADVQKAAFPFITGEPADAFSRDLQAMMASDLETALAGGEELTEELVETTVRAVASRARSWITAASGKQSQDNANYLNAYPTGPTGQPAVPAELTREQVDAMPRQQRETLMDRIAARARQRSRAQGPSAEA